MKPLPFEIREATPLDLPRFKFVIDHGPYRGNMIDPDLFREYFPRTLYVLVAVWPGGELAAQVFVSAQDEGGILFDYLFFLWVDPEIRGLGLGTAILAQIERRARLRGADLILGVDLENTRARALYERLGFTEYARNVYRSRQVAIDGTKLQSDNTEQAYMVKRLREE